MAGCKFRLAAAYSFPRNPSERPPLPRWLAPGREVGAEYTSLRVSYNYWTKVYWATPPWLTEKMWRQMKRVYESTNSDQHVDHIVPLKGETVCGLHVPWNLRRSSAEANMSKGNRWWPGMWYEQDSFFPEEPEPHQLSLI